MAARLGDALATQHLVHKSSFSRYHSLVKPHRSSGIYELCLPLVRQTVRITSLLPADFSSLFS